MTFKAKLIAQTLFALAVIVFMAAMTVMVARDSSRTISQVFEEEMVPALALGVMDVSLRTIHNRMMGAVMEYYPYEGSQQNLAEHEAQVLENWERFKAAHRDRRKIPPPDEQAHINQVDLFLPGLRIFVHDAREALKQGDDHVLNEMLFERWPAVYSNLIKSIEQLRVIHENDANLAHRQGVVQARDNAYVAMGSALAAVLLLTGVMLWLTLRLSKGIRLIHDGLESLARREFDRPVPITGTDELAGMAAALNQTAALLKADRTEILALKTRNELILDAIGEGLYVTDKQGNITQANPAAAAMTGWSVEELIGKPSHATLHHTRPDGSRYPREECPMYATYRDGHVHKSENDHFWRKNGTLFPVQLISTPIKEDGRVTGTVVVFSDISARKDAEWAIRETMKELRETNRKLEEAHNQLLQSEKMASIGQLAAGVAHEINNPIGYVYSNLGTLGKYLADLFRLIDEYGEALKQLDGTPEAERLMALESQLDLEFLRQDLNALMDESREGITRVKKIIQDLKDFSRAGTNEEFQWADLHQGLESTLNIVHNELKYKARVTKHYAELPQIECLPSQLNQVFMNLLVNAAHAIEGQGDITISTGRESDQVWVKIADTGCGIAPENLKRIFDPFFTTKAVGKGTGLGLSLAYGIVQKHHGSIEVESEVGSGTRFTVWLPIRQSEMASHD